MKPLVSAVITSYMRPAQVVERALKSVLRQTYPNLEVLLVDDSPENYPLRKEVAAMAKGYAGQNVRYLPHETNLGACAARNTGLQNARGEFIAYLDDDDEWYPEKIEKQLARMDDPGVVLVYCESDVFNEDTGERRARGTRVWEGRVYEQLVLRNFIGSTSFPLIRREALLEIGGFDMKMRSAQDYDVWLRLAAVGDFRCVPEALAVYHVHTGEQISKNPDNRIAGLERLNEKNRDYIEKHRGAYWIRWMQIIPFYLQKDQKEKALRTWKACIRKCPFKLKKNLKYGKMIVKHRQKEQS